MKPKIITGAIIAFAVIGLATSMVVRSARSTEEPSASLDFPPEKDSAAGAAIVHLTDSKRTAAKIEMKLVERQTLRLSRTLPARFVYDDTRHVAVRSPSEGVLEAVLVKPGDTVSVGQPLAQLRSPAIGDARSRILSCQANLKLAQKSLQWESRLHSGIEEMTRLIRAGSSSESIRETLRDQVLGDLGGQLLLQYSRSELAAGIARSVGSVADSGAISGRIIRERTSAQQQAQAELESSTEQTLFQAKLSVDTAEAAVAAATRDLQIAKQSLSTLLGATANPTGELDVSPNDPNLSRLTTRSPLAGTVESRGYSATERVIAHSDLFVIADTTTLWVEADIRSRDWDSIAVSPGDTVMVSTPAVRDAPQPATVYYVGREVDPASGALPLVAQISNAGGHYRPGVFARVAVPTSTLDNVIAIPTSALVDLDGQSSVFTQHQGDFKAVPVELGHTSDDRVEIRSGLEEGQSIVVAGAFILKSELLLGGGE